MLSLFPNPPDDTNGSRRKDEVANDVVLRKKLRELEYGDVVMDGDGWADIARSWCTTDLAGNMVLRGESDMNRRFGLLIGESPWWSSLLARFGSILRAGSLLAPRPLGWLSSMPLVASGFELVGNSTPRRLSQSFFTLSSNSGPLGRSVEPTGISFLLMMNIDSSESDALSDAVVSFKGSTRSRSEEVMGGRSGTRSGMLSGMTSGILGPATSEVVLEHTESAGVLIASWKDGGG